jgi:hypothetical protein
MKFFKITLLVFLFDNTALSSDSKYCNRILQNTNSTPAFIGGLPSDGIEDELKYYLQVSRFENIQEYEPHPDFAAAFSSSTPNYISQLDRKTVFLLNKQVIMTDKERF